MSDSFEVFEGKTLSDVFKDIYKNSENNKQQIEVLMKDLLKFVTDTASAVALVPILKDYLDVAVKNAPNIQCPIKIPIKERGIEIIITKGTLKF